MAKKKTGRYFTVEFCVSGLVTQEVKITDPKMTEGKLDRLLNEGKVATSIQERGSLIVVKTGRKIGQVVAVENDCEYTEFMVTEED